MARLMQGSKKIILDDLKSVQTDVYLISAVKLRDLMVEKLTELSVDGAGDVAQKNLISALKQWDGRYRVAAKGPVAFELLYHALSGPVRKRLYKPEIATVMASQARSKAIFAADLKRLKPEDLKADLQSALAGAGAKFGAYRNWGEMHRLALRHPLGQMPLVGGRFRFVDVPAEGGNDTLWKTAHNSTDARHDARYGSNARHISDLSHPDANYFVLLGGQDGWFNSANFTDQVKLWLTGKYVQVPLTLKAVRKNAVHKTVLEPKR